MTDLEHSSAQMIVVRQLPIIEERLREAAEDIKRRTEEACQLACTEESLQTVKKVRAELNREYQEYEAARKAVKNKIMAPYEEFEQTYKFCIADSFQKADRELKGMINSVEFHIRDRKEKKLREFYAMHLEAAGLDYSDFPFERCGLSVTMSASEKSLKEAAKGWIAQRKQDLEAISAMESADEISAEYKSCLNMAQAVKTVQERKAEAERERLAREAKEADKAAKAAAVAAEKAQGLAAPVPVKNEAEERVLELHFKVWGTREQLKALKKFLEDGGYKYE